MKLHIITGGSKGLGAGVSDYLSKRGDQIISIARSAGSPAGGIKSYSFDFSKTESVISLLDQIFSDYPMGNYEQISLVNNAGIVEPIGKTDSLFEDEILKNLVVDLYFPIALSSVFLNRLRHFTGRKLIVNISSGVAKRPKPGWLVYSAAKAGLENFSEGLLKEFSQDTRLRIISFNPGVMDTEMQEKIRSSQASDFPDWQRFMDLKANGQLASPRFVGEVLGKLILGEVAPEKNFVSIEDFFGGEIK